MNEDTLKAIRKLVSEGCTISFDGSEYPTWIKVLVCRKGNCVSRLVNPLACDEAAIDVTSHALYWCRDKLGEP